jgi:hypothetical protein
MVKRSSNRQIRAWKALALLSVAVPVILLLKLFNIEQYMDRSVEEVAGYIRDFLERSGGD